MPERSYQVDNEGLADMVVLVALATLDSADLGTLAGGDPINVGDLHAYIRSRVDYLPDTATDRQRIRAPWITLRDGVGDCKSTAILAYCLARLNGNAAFLRFYDQTGNGWDHVAAIVDGVACDPLLDLGTEVDYVRKRDVYI